MGKEIYEKASETSITMTKPVEIITKEEVLTFEYVDLLKQRDAIVAQRDAMIALKEAELKQVDELIAKCKELGIKEASQIEEIKDKDNGKQI